MRSIIKWVYRLLLFCPLTFFFCSLFWYYYVKSTYGHIPLNDYLHGVDDNVIRFSYDVGTFLFIGNLLSVLILLIIFPLHILTALLTKKTELKVNWKHDGLMGLLVVITFILNFYFPSAISAFSYYLLD